MGTNCLAPNTSSGSVEIWRWQNHTKPPAETESLGWPYISVESFKAGSSIFTSKILKRLQWCASLWRGDPMVRCQVMVFHGLMWSRNEAATWQSEVPKRPRVFVVEALSGWSQSHKGRKNDIPIFPPVSLRNVVLLFLLLQPQWSLIEIFELAMLFLQYIATSVACCAEPGAKMDGSSNWDAQALRSRPFHSKVVYLWLIFSNDSIVCFYNAPENPNVLKAPACEREHQICSGVWRRLL